jgi:hypothetical protein
MGSPFGRPCWSYSVVFGRAAGDVFFRVGVVVTPYWSTSRWAPRYPPVEKPDVSDAPRVEKATESRMNPPVSYDSASFEYGVYRFLVFTITLPGDSHFFGV